MIKCQLFSEKVEHTYTQSIHKHIHHYLLFSLSLFFCFLFFGVFLLHVQVPGPGVEPPPQLWPAPTLWQCRILNLLCHTGISIFFFFFFPKYLPLWKQKLSLPCSQNKFVFVLSFNMPMRNFSTTLWKKSKLVRLFKSQYLLKGLCIWQIWTLKRKRVASKAVCK